MPRKLKCFTVMVRGQYYRKGSRIHTVHAVSEQHGYRLLSAEKGFKLFHTMYLVENSKCDPQSGKCCNYMLVVQPEYGITPRESNEPQPSPVKEISPSRQDIIDKMRKQRPDLYGDD